MSIVTKLNQQVKDILFKGGRALFIKLLGMAIGYLYIYLIAKSLGASGVGAFTISFTFLMIASVFGRLGMDMVFLRKIAKLNISYDIQAIRNIRSKGIKVSLLACTLIIIVGYSVTHIISGKLLNNEDYTHYINIILLGVIPVALFYLNSEALRAIGFPEDYSFLQNSSLLLWATLFLFLIPYASISKTVMLWTIVGSSSLTWLISEILCRYRFSRINNKTLEYTDVLLTYKDMLRIGIPMMFVGSLTFLMSWTDILMIGHFMPEEEVGKYSIALRISYIVSISLYAVNSVISPRLSAAFAKNNMDEFRNISVLTSKLGITLGGIAFLFIVIFNEIILSFFGKEFLDSNEILILLAIGQFINVACGSVGYVLSMTGKQNQLSLIILFATIINFLLNALLIPLLGIKGAAIATMVSTIAWNVIALFFIRYMYGFWMIRLT